jgi:hypothetical protein
MTRFTTRLAGIVPVTIIAVAAFAATSASAARARTPESGAAPAGFIATLNEAEPKIGEMCTESPTLCKEARIPPAIFKQMIGMARPLDIEKTLDELDAWCAAHPFRCAIVIVIVFGVAYRPPITNKEQEAVKALLPYVKLKPSGIGGKPTIQFSGVNVQVVSGTGNETTVNGAGNLIVGYDEEPGKQTGSNNLVVRGFGAEYTGFAELLP